MSKTIAVRFFASGPSKEPLPLLFVAFYDTLGKVWATCWFDLDKIGLKWTSSKIFDNLRVKEWCESVDLEHNWDATLELPVKF